MHAQEAVSVAPVEVKITNESEVTGVTVIITDLESSSMDEEEFSLDPLETLGMNFTGEAKRALISTGWKTDCTRLRLVNTHSCIWIVIRAVSTCKLMVFSVPMPISPVVSCSTT